MSAARGRFDASLDRLHRLYPKLIDLQLDRLVRLLGALGDPQLRLPPVIHVAGTNGKGSVCAFVRAMAEAAGLRVHVYTSPHLVKFNERIRLAGALVSDEALAGALDEIEAVNEGNQITVFEAITAAAFLLFAQVPADLCVVEVGLGGRFDATNVVWPAACAITSISLDHQDFLGDTLRVIAAEKAGIIKPACRWWWGCRSPKRWRRFWARRKWRGRQCCCAGATGRLRRCRAGCGLRVGAAAAGVGGGASGGKCWDCHDGVAGGWV